MVVDGIPSGSKSGSTYGTPALIPLTTSPIVWDVPFVTAPWLLDVEGAVAESFLSVDSKVSRTRSKCSSSFALCGY